MTLERGGANRIGARTGTAFTITFEGRDIPAWPGESVGAALHAADELYLRRDETGGARGLLCGIGVCWECRCTVDGRPNTRACMTEAEPGMVVRRQEGLG